VATKIMERKEGAKKMSMFELWLRWYALRIRIAWWGFWAALGFRVLAWSWRERMGTPRWYEFWMFRHASRWSENRWNAVWEATQPARWKGGSSHPTQKRLEPDPQLNPNRDGKSS
jgi:hypothetical protein